MSIWHAKVVVKSSLADLKKLISASHCFALVWTRDTVSTCKQLQSGLSSSSSSNCWIFFDDRHTDAKWPFFWLHVFLNAEPSVLLLGCGLRPQYLQVGSKQPSDFFFLTSSLNSTIFLNLSSYCDFYREISSRWISLRLLSCCLLHLLSSWFAARRFHSYCTSVWLSSSPGIFPSRISPCHLDSLSQWRACPW